MLVENKCGSRSGPEMLVALYGRSTRVNGLHHEWSDLGMERSTRADGQRVIVRWSFN